MDSRFGFFSLCVLTIIFAIAGDGGGESMATEPSDPCYTDIDGCDDDSDCSPDEDKSDYILFCLCQYSTRKCVEPGLIPDGDNINDLITVEDIYDEQIDEGYETGD